MYGSARSQDKIIPYHSIDSVSSNIKNDLQSILEICWSKDTQAFHLENNK
jgi:hypothetical protein